MIPEHLRDKIAAIQNKLKELPIEAKMVERENLHISLSFLGEVEEDKIGEIHEKLDDICGRYEPSVVGVFDVKFIPNEKYFRVLALDCHGSLLKILGRDIEKEVGGEVKPPHLTLCRISNIREKNETLDKIKKIDTSIGEFTLSSVQLIKSQLQKTGPLYTVLRESYLHV
jgi:2'-5' RNA ligase